MFFELTLLILMAILAGSLLVATLRLIRGPDQIDRLIALQVVTLHTLALLLLYAIIVQEMSLLDTLLILVVGVLVIAVAFSRFLVEKSQ